MARKRKQRTFEPYPGTPGLHDPHGHERFDGPRKPEVPELQEVIDDGAKPGRDGA